MKLVHRGPWPPNPHHVRHFKFLSAVSDARKGCPVGPVHPAQGEVCDIYYARHYLWERARLMTQDERDALGEAEAEFAEAMADMEEAVRRAETARARITRLVAPGNPGKTPVI